jgi:uncharacterized membrane protein YdjX (TVP38/TMEM64 family)
MPMDVISYALGLFTRVTWQKYIAATLLGLAPPAFLLTYIGRLPHAYEVFAIGIVAVLVLGAALVRTRLRHA